MRFFTLADSKRVLLQLHQYCVESEVDNEYFMQRVAELKKVWKDKTE